MTADPIRYWWPRDDDAPLDQLGLQVVVNNVMRDGDLAVTRTHIILGTRPWTDLEQAGERGRRIVRHGLADVLDWLGEHPGPTPDDPYPVHGYKDLLAALARAGDLRPPPTEPIDYQLTPQAYQALADVVDVDDG